MRKQWFALAIGFWAIAASAQVAGGGDGNTWGQLLVKGGPVMVVLAVMSMLTLCLSFYYLFTLRSELVVPPGLMKQLEAALAQRDYSLMARVCETDGSPAAKVIAAGLSMHRRAKRNYALVSGALEDEGARQAGVLWGRIQYLQDIAVIAPMVGLLGTVIGMIQSFVGMQAQDAVPRPTVIANGISMALVTTVGGLVLGIMAMMVYAWFRGRLQGVVTDLEVGCGRIAVELLDHDS